ncbi:MAG: ABC transporter permease [Acidobacteriia bacterium]|nr:ABC transporter permease [Terriglobia bacterium]
MGSLLQDLRYALRTLARTPGFTAVIVISIALGIAANTTVFSIVNGLMLGVLPVRDPQRLVSFSGRGSLSYPDYIDYRDQTKDVFEGVAAHFPFIPASLGGAGEPERAWGEAVSGNYFSILGIKPQQGRFIVPAEDEVQGRDAVVVLSYDLWRRRFASDAAVVGRSVVLNGQRYTVVGVAPAGFHGASRGILPEFWVPLAMAGQIMPDLGKLDVVKERNNQWLLVMARLKPDVTRTQAIAAVNVVTQRIDDTYHKDRKGCARRAVSLTTAGGLFGDIRQPAVGLMAILTFVVGLVLLAACANVANLLLARATVRQKEIAIRTALGAGRRRLVRQLLTESLLLALLGAAGGLVLAAFAARGISRFELPLPIPLLFDFNVDLRVLAFTAGLAILTTLLFGLAPALRATRPDLVAALKSESTILTRVGRLSLRNALVVVQVALSMVLLVGTGLFLRSLANASSMDLGMRPENVLLMAFDPKLQHYSHERAQQFLSDLRERVSPLAGVQAVSYVDSIPLSIGGINYDFNAGGGNAGSAQPVNADVYDVGSDFFKTMGIPLLRGRDFNRQTDDERVAIINETMARQLFPKDDPLGRTMLSTMASEKTTFTVIGIARDSKSRTLGEKPSTCAYLFVEPNPEKVMSWFGISIVVKTASHPRGLVRQVREQIGRLDPNLAVFNVETMQEHVDKSLLLPRISALLLGVFGTVGLTLAAIGLYGVMSFSVRRRTREIGIRMALGANPAGVLKMVVRQGLTLTGVGLVIGLALAFVLGRFASSLLYGVSGTDNLTFVAVTLVLLAAALAAIIFPARRAARVEPTTALHYE